MGLRYWVIALMAIVVAFAAAGDNDRVRVGIAWQPTAASYERVILSIEQAGGEAVILPQLRPAGFDYDDMVLCPKYVDEMGVLRQEYADIVKRDTYHGTDADELLAGVQAVVFLGGGDISSTLFAVPQTWHGIADDSPANATRDVSEYLTMAYCLDHDIPVLGLCRGMQMLGVVSGAPLIQDLGKFFDEMGKNYHFLHRMQRDAEGKRYYTPHDVTVIDTTSLLYAVTGTETIFDVPSWHHQVVGDVTGTPLRVTGVTSTDGIDIIEAIERTDKHFALGVQYHPEEAIRKHLTGQPDADRFMPLDEAVKYFTALIGHAQEGIKFIPGRAYTRSDTTDYPKTAAECYNFFAVLGRAEQGSLDGAAAELSLLLNLYERRHPDAGDVSIQEIAKWATECGWFAHASRRWEKTATPEYLAVARNVLGGNRVMPSNIVEHDCMEDLAYIETNGVRYSPYQRDKYVSGVTVCYQAVVHEHNGRKFGFRHPTHWVFYSFPAAKSDPFGWLCDEGCGHENSSREEDIIR
jgi:putative glutamine amidotransferase